MEVESLAAKVNREFEAERLHERRCAAARKAVATRKARIAAMNREERKAMKERRTAAAFQAHETRGTYDERDAHDRWSIEQEEAEQAARDAYWMEQISLDPAPVYNDTVQVPF